MSSSFTYTLRKRRICPASSRKCGFRSGNFSSSTANNSPMFAAEQLKLPTPEVCRRSAVGICTVIDISGLHHFGNVEGLREEAVKRGECGSNGGFRLEFSRNSIGRLQAVARDAHDGRLVRCNA